MPSRTSCRTLSMAICVSALLIAPSSARDFSPSATAMFMGLRAQTNDLARYLYLLKTTPTLPVADQQLALQMFASVENELGLYNQALRDFPLKSHALPETRLPNPEDWVSTDAIDAITSMAKDRRLVMVNEAHHDGHTRELTLALLPRLRAMGFNYLAIEALSDKDGQLMQRGYVVEDSGTEYLREPMYGEIVRTAVRLGFILVPYDLGPGSQGDRESAQASNLYEKTFAKDPHARVFVHAGYAHIDKAKGRLGSAQPMAAYLQRISGIVPLSIDQTQFREQIPAERDAYRQLVAEFPSIGPIILVNRITGKAWSASPELYDVNVLLPPGSTGIVDSGFVRPVSNARASDLDHLMLPDPLIKLRPDWLTLQGQRMPYPINSSMCRTSYPCVIDAHPVDEPDNATASDRYAFMQGNVVSKLYLRPGQYRLHAWGVNDQTLAEQLITVNPR